MNFEIDFVESYSRENVVRELQRLAAALGKNTLTLQDIKVHGRISGPVVYARFGSLRHALLEAGLEPGKCRFTNQELCFFLVQVWTHTFQQYGRSPMRQDLRTFGCKVHPSTFAKRFGGWNRALLAAAEFMPADEAHAPPLATPRAAPPRKRLSLRKRFLVFKRDRYRCCMCKRAGLELEVDHKVPYAQHGTDALDNLQTLCVECNRGKRHSSE